MPKTHPDPGLVPGVSAYVLWGLLPLYLVLLVPATPWEVFGLRIVWANLFCLVRSPKTLLALALAAGCISINWGVYIYAVATQRASEGALGYFLNPLVSVALAPLSERPRAR